MNKLAKFLYVTIHAVIHCGAIFCCGIIARQIFDILTSNTTPDTAGLLIFSAMGAAMAIVADIELSKS